MCLGVSIVGDTACDGVTGWGGGGGAKRQKGAVYGQEEQEEEQEEEEKQVGVGEEEDISPFSFVTTYALLTPEREGNRKPHLVGVQGSMVGYKETLYSFNCY